MGSTCHPMLSSGISSHESLSPDFLVGKHQNSEIFLVLLLHFRLAATETFDLDFWYLASLYLDLSLCLCLCILLDFVFVFSPGGH